MKSKLQPANSLLINGATSSSGLCGDWVWWGYSSITTGRQPVLPDNGKVQFLHVRVCFPSTFLMLPNKEEKGFRDDFQSSLSCSVFVEMLYIYSEAT